MASMVIKDSVPWKQLLPQQSGTYEFWMPTDYSPSHLPPEEMPPPQHPMAFPQSYKNRSLDISQVKLLGHMTRDSVMELYALQTESKWGGTKRAFRSTGCALSTSNQVGGGSNIYTVCLTSPLTGAERLKAKVHWQVSKGNDPKPDLPFPSFVVGCCNCCSCTHGQHWLHAELGDPTVSNPQLMTGHVCDWGWGALHFMNQFGKQPFNSLWPQAAAAGAAVNGLAALC